MFKFLNPHTKRALRSAQINEICACFGVRVNKNRGFTIVEFLIVISIIGILSVIAFPNYRSTQQRLALQRSASKLAQDIRRSQEMSMSMKELSTGDLPEGYGIYIYKNDSDCPDDDCYHIYADIDGDERYDPGEEQGETIFLEKEVYIENFVPFSNNFSINFKPPNPTVKMKNQAGTDSDAITIIVALKADSSITKTIKVNKAGLIYVE